MAKHDPPALSVVPTGPITAQNYSTRARDYCLQRSADRKGEHPTITLASPEFPDWLEYFDHHLGRRPPTFQMLLEGEIDAFTVPERTPEWFDRTFVPAGEPSTTLDFDDDHRERMQQRAAAVLADIRRGNDMRKLSPDEIARRAAHVAAVKAQIASGIRWIVEPNPDPRWRRYTDAELLAIYPPKEPT